jgi:hypothetical protein
MDQRTFHLRRNSDKVGKHLGIIRSRVVIRAIENSQPEA